MGTILTKNPVKKIDKEMILVLKKNTMKDIFDCIEIVHKLYPYNRRLDYEKFDNIFSNLVSDSEPIFNQLREKSGMNSDDTPKYLVDLYESLAIFALFSSETYEVKIAFIFRLFDFDVSETIEPQELTSSVQCVVRGLCKMVNIEPPAYSFLESISQTCFQIMDLDHNSHIEFDEYITWISNNDEFQDFLLKYSGTITYPYAKRRQINILNQLCLMYDNLKGKTIENEVIFEDLKNALLNDELKNYDQSIQDYILNLIVYTSMFNKNDLYEITDEDIYDSEDESSEKIKKPEIFEEKKSETVKREKKSQQKNDEKPEINLIKNLKVKRIATQFSEIENNSDKDEMLKNRIISKKTFLNVIRPWASFSAADINLDNYLSIAELKFLIWIYEDEEPNEWRLKAEMIEIDKDNSGSIDRIEWLKHLCVEEEKTGRQVFRNEIKELFQKFDTDNSGFLSNSEITVLIKTIFKKYLLKANSKNEKTKYDVSKMISKLSNDIIDELNNDCDKNLNWTEFKYFMDKTMEKQAELAKFLDGVL